MKYEKIGGLWIGGGAECLRSNRTKQNRETGEKQRKNSDIITGWLGQVMEQPLESSRGDPRTSNRCAGDSRNTGVYSCRCVRDGPAVMCRVPLQPDGVHWI